MLGAGTCMNKALTSPQACATSKSMYWAHFSLNVCMFIMFSTAFLLCAYPDVQLYDNSPCEVGGWWPFVSSIIKGVVYQLFLHIVKGSVYQLFLPLLWRLYINCSSIVKRDVYQLFHKKEEHGGEEEVKVHQFLKSRYKELINYTT